MDLGIGSPRAGTFPKERARVQCRTCARMCLADRRSQAIDEDRLLVGLVEAFTDVEGRQGREDQSLNGTGEQTQKHHRQGHDQRN